MGRLRGVAGIKFPEHNTPTCSPRGGPPRSCEGRDYEAQAKTEPSGSISGDPFGSGTPRERFASDILMGNRGELNQFFCEFAKISFFSDSSEEIFIGAASLRKAKYLQSVCGY
jgi:hypothetical protein